MAHALRLGLWLLALSLSFYVPILALPQSAFSVSADALVAQNPADEPALRTLAEAFFKTWSAKDLDGFLRLWSARSPEREARRKATQELFTGSEKIELRGLTIRAVKMDGDKARVRVEVDAQVTEAKTGKEKPGYGKMLRTLECVKEAGNWKVWREASTFDELAAALAATRSDEERATLLATEKELMTAELVFALNVQGNRRPYPQSLVIQQLAQSIGERIGDKVGVARSLLNVGNVHKSQDNLALASEYYQKSLALSEALGDKAGIAGALNNIGNVNQAQGNYERALESYRKSLAVFEALENKDGIATTSGNLGLIYFQQGNHAQALESYQKSLAMFEALGNQAGIGSLLNNLGLVHHRQGNFAQALEYFQKSLALREAVGDKAGIATTLANLGLVHHQQGNYAQALEYFQKNLAMFKALGGKEGIAGAFNNIGRVHRIQGNYAQALDSYQKGLATFEAMGNKYGIALVLHNIGNVHRLQGNYAQALETFQKSLALREAIGDKAGIASTLNNLGLVHRLQGNYAQALGAFQKSLALSEAMGNKPGIASALNSIGRVHQSQGNHVQAMEEYQKSLALREAVGDKAGIADTLNNIGEVYETQGRYSQALDTASRTAALAGQIGHVEALWKARLAAGTAYRALNQPVQARSAFEEAITISETLRAQVAGGEVEQQRFFESKVSPYHALVDLLSTQRRPAEALTFAERAKARVLLDVLQTGRVNITKATTREQQEQERKLRVELISLNTQLARASQSDKLDQADISELKSLREKARLSYEAFQTSLYAAHPELRVQRGEAPVIKAEEIAALLPDAASALLEYVVTDDATYLFTVTKAAEIQVFTLPVKQAELAKQTESLRRQLAGRDLGFRATARRLYQLLLKPAQAQLRGKTNLIIVPDDKLWELPFQALLAEGDRYVIERSAVSYTPSLTVLREMKSQRGKRQAGTVPSALLALGNPAIGKDTIERMTQALRGSKLDPLPEAEAEVKALGRLYGAARSKVYVGVEAREDRAKAEAAQAGILHFATHGVLNDASPMYSHLVLASGDKNEDGLLEAWELMQLDLKAELAVLSACETARGRFGAGEGVIGLSWALFVAGVPTTIVSQWKVESAGTRELMLRFHQQLRAPSKVKATKAEALRQAALKLMRNPATSHPFYWAGFVLVGDGR